MMKKVGNIEFNVANVKKMSFTQFKSIYKGLLRLVDIEDAYEVLTGKKARKSAKKKKV